MQANGRIGELILLDGNPAARIVCPPGLVPAPGQYLLAHAEDSDAPLATAVFAARTPVPARQTEEISFIAAGPLPVLWLPGTCLHLRGPLGHGFSVPASARRIALVALDAAPSRLLALLDTAFRQNAGVTVVCARAPEDLPLQVEIQPLTALIDVCKWADYAAFDTARESFPELKEKLAKLGLAQRPNIMQGLVRVPMPCGGLAQCGVCAVELSGGYQLACEDGPVFDLKALLI
jgi:NAD(P)H-flavin reductase